MKTINNRHLSSHDITAEEYKNRFPCASLLSEASADFLSKRSIKSNESRKGSKRSLEDRKKMSIGQKKHYETHEAHNKGKAMSAEQKQLLSDRAHERYNNGFVHPNSGKKLKQETKEKIAATLSDFYEIKKPEMRTYMLDSISKANLILKNTLSDDNFILECKKCGTNLTRHYSMFHNSNFHTKICMNCFPSSYVSNGENEVAAFIKEEYPSITIIRSSKEIISPFEIDIYLPEYKIAIEYCGLYWHSETSGKHRMYHKYKLDHCKDKGIHLITIFEDEWINRKHIVQSILKNIIGITTNLINARSCFIKEISSDVASKFLDDNHIYGHGRSKKRYGLFYFDDLVSVMTFSQSELSRRNEKTWEISRFANRTNTVIRGGASKLFKAFIRSTTPSEVISYADLRYGEGNVYSHLGFIRENTTFPNYWYFREGILKRYHRFTLRKTPNDPIDMSEWEIRKQQGWNRIWDCGHAKWIWTK